MTLHLPPETEARLTKEAKKHGLTVEGLIERLIGERATGVLAQEARALPVWHLGSAGAYHRRDIYDDAD
jgi:hypothetical protein